MRRPIFQTNNPKLATSPGRLIKQHRVYGQADLNSFSLGKENGGSRAWRSLIGFGSRLLTRSRDQLRVRAKSKE